MHFSDYLRGRTTGELGGIDERRKSCYYLDEDILVSKIEKQWIINQTQNNSKETLFPCFISLHKLRYLCFIAVCKFTHDLLKAIPNPKY